METKSLILIVAGGLVFLFLIGQINDFTGKSVDRPWEIECSRYRVIDNKEVDKFGASQNTAEYVKLVINKRPYEKYDDCV